MACAALGLAWVAGTGDVVGTGARNSAAMLGFVLSGALYALGLAGAVLGAQSMTNERQSQTLELLEVSGLATKRIIGGKAAAVWLVLTLLWLSCLPALTVCFIVGGVSAFQFLVVTLAPATVTIVPVALGIWLGTVQRSPRLAVGVAVTTIGVAGPALFSMAWAAMLFVFDLDGLGRQFPLPLATGSWHETVTAWMLVPLYCVAAPAWFFLASAVTSLSHVGQDRSRPLQQWMAVVGPLGGFVAGLVGLIRGVDLDGAMTLLGLVALPLGLGAWALAARPAPQGARDRALFAPGPSRDALVTVLASALSLALAALLLWPGGGPITLWAAGYLFCFILLTAGGGVLLASLLPSRLARGTLVAVTLAIVLLPLFVWLSAELAGPGSAARIGPIVALLSPMAALINLTTPESSTSHLGNAAAGMLFWCALGVGAWHLGRRRLEQQTKE
jgi:ABC-type transport system involved in multi-copper enzyme maturation permease subunit